MFGKFYHKHRANILQRALNEAIARELRDSDTLKRNTQLQYDLHEERCTSATLRHKIKKLEAQRPSTDMCKAMLDKAPPVTYSFAATLAQNALRAMFPITNEEKADRNAVLYGCVDMGVMRTQYGKEYMALHRIATASQPSRYDECRPQCKPRKKRMYWSDENLSEKFIYIYCSHSQPGDKQGHFARFHNDDAGRKYAEQYVLFLNSVAD